MTLTPNGQTADPIYEQDEWTITASSRAPGADWYGVMIPQTVRASSLHEALDKALQLPFANWCGTEDGPAAITIMTDEAGPFHAPL